jgi:hypothetical protein
MVDATNARLQEMTAVTPDNVLDREKLLDREAQRRAVLKSGLADLEKQLSPDGWMALQAEMTRVANVRGIPVGGPPASPPR